ncbi:MAG: 1,4-dihydroxy-2-naphthoate prenyltransferase, partial [Microbacterium sp.]|nr:1,4-dihydroxy-2-naphthoate prenyltransferase [Microbacterium sp.]
AVVGPALAAGAPVAATSWVAGGAVVAVSAWGLAATITRGPSRLSFRLVMLSALLLAAQLVVTTWLGR